MGAISAKTIAMRAMRGSQGSVSKTKWFAGLSEQDKSVAKAATDTYRNGYQMRAKQIAAALPPAPRYPLD